MINRYLRRCQSLFVPREGGPPEIMSKSENVTSSDGRRILPNPARMAFALMLAGRAVRLVQFVFCRSLWLDGASLSLNIVNRSYLSLLQPLSYHRARRSGCFRSHGSW